MKIYISGQITGLTEKEYTENFIEATVKVCKRDIIQGRWRIGELMIVNPLDIKPLFGIKKWLFFMISDLKKLRECTHIAMQPNWIESRGAIIEYFFAKFIYKIKIIWL